MIIILNERGKERVLEFARGIVVLGLRNQEKKISLRKNFDPA